MCDFTCTKYLVFIFNLLFCILGLVMIGVGAWAYDDDKFLDKVDVNFEELAEVTKGKLNERPRALGNTNGLVHPF